MLFLMHEETVPFQLKPSCSPTPLKHRKILSLPQRKRWLGSVGDEWD